MKIEFLAVGGFDPLFVTVNGSRVRHVTEPVNGPLMIEHPDVDGGRPTSAYDIEAIIRGILVVNPSLTNPDTFAHCVPIDRDFSQPFDPSMFENVSVRRLHSESTNLGSWRGRPCSFTQFPLETLIRWRSAIFTGDLTIRDLAKKAGVSEPAASRFAHAETLWYV